MADWCSGAGGFRNPAHYTLDSFLNETNGLFARTPLPFDRKVAATSAADFDKLCEFMQDKSGAPMILNQITFALSALAKSWPYLSNESKKRASQEITVLLMAASSWARAIEQGLTPRHLHASLDRKLKRIKDLITIAKQSKEKKEQSDQLDPISKCVIKSASSDVAAALLTICKHGRSHPEDQKAISQVLSEVWK